jgi:hypothetical protein
MFNFFQPLTDNTSLLDFIIYLFPYLIVVAKLFTNFLNFLGFFKFILSHFFKFINLMVPYIVKFIARSVNYIYGFSKLQKKTINISKMSQILVMKTLKVVLKKKSLHIISTQK